MFNIKNLCTTALIICLFQNLLSQIETKSTFFDKKIIAFGEASHGDGAVYEARKELIKEYKKYKKDSTLNILIEMPQSMCYAIKDYFSGEIDSVMLLKQARYFGLQTTSFLDFLNTYRNDSSIKFYGIVCFPPILRQ